MESKEDLVHLSAASARQRLINEQVEIVKQLIQAAPRMSQADEMFQWLAFMFVQRLNVSVVQFWAAQAFNPTQITIVLRAQAYANRALDPGVVVNETVAATIERVLSERRGIMPQPVASLFSSAQADLCTRNQLSYWSSYFLSNTALLPVAHNPTPRRIATPLTMAVSLFFQLAPNSRLMPTVSQILEQATMLARNQGLLLTNKL